VTIPRRPVRVVMDRGTIGRSPVPVSEALRWGQRLGESRRDATGPSLGDRRGRLPGNLRWPASEALEEGRPCVPCPSLKPNAYGLRDNSAGQAGEARHDLSHTGARLAD
jgi:hypothetical protein